MEIEISTPALLFPAISLLLLAYTNRFLTFRSNRKSKKKIRTYKMDAIFWSSFYAYVYCFYVLTIFRILCCGKTNIWIEFGYYVFVFVYFIMGSLYLFKCFELRVERLAREVQVI
jgi:hypothetical protein